MADITDTRLREMEDEMNRFEEEILSRGSDGRMPHPSSMLTNNHGGSAIRFATGMQPLHGQVGFQPSPAFIPPQLKNRAMLPPPRPIHPMVPISGNFPIRPFAQPNFPQRPPHVPMFNPQATQSIPKKPEILTGPKPSSSNVVVSAPKIFYSSPSMNDLPSPPDGFPAKEEKPTIEIPVVVPVASPPPKEPEKKSTSKPSSSKSKDKKESSSGMLSFSDGKKEKKDKKKKYMRMAAGTIWEDPTLMEWESDDFRLFCGDLGNEVTDDVLNRVFAKYPSFQKARVIRDKRTNKTKGYGFASFKDPGDFMKAMRELNGKYVGNRPIKLRKSCWQDRQVDNVKKKEKEKKKLGFR